MTDRTPLWVRTWRVLTRPSVRVARDRAQAAALERALLDLKGAELTLERLYDPTPCCVTESAFCQAHGFLVTPDCPNEAARRFLIRQGVISK